MHFVRLRIFLLAVLSALLITADIQPQATHNINSSYFNSWIYEPYYNEIVNTGSVYKTYKNHGWHFIGFMREQDEVLLTSLTEGQTFRYSAESGNKIKVLNKDTGKMVCTLSLTLHGNKPRLILRQGTDARVFVPLNKKYNSPDLNKNIEMFVNDLIISGNYKTVKENKSFVFNSDGSLSGFGNYNHYLIPLSGSGVPFNFDIVLLQEREAAADNQSGTIKSNLFLHWKKVNGNLILYRLSKNSPDGRIAEKYLELKKVR